MAPRELEPRVASTGGWGGKPDLGQNLRRREGGREIAPVELLRCQRPTALGTAHGDACVQADGDGGQLGGRVGVSEAPADRPSVSDLEVANPGHRVGQERNLARDERALLHGPLPRHRANSDAILALPDVLELADAIEVDQPPRHSEPHVEHRHQALPTGEELGVLAVAGQLRHCFLGRSHPDVLEGRRLHSAAGSGKSTSVRRRRAGVTRPGALEALRRPGRPGGALRDRRAAFARAGPRIRRLGPGAWTRSWSECPRPGSRVWRRRR